jgi:hypothetical protein
MSEKAKSHSTKPVSDASTSESSSAAGEILTASSVQPAVRPTSQRLADLGARWKGAGGVSPQNTTPSGQPVPRPTSTSAEGPASSVQPAVRPTSQRLADLGARWKGGVWRPRFGSEIGTSSAAPQSAPATPPTPSDEATDAVVEKLKRTGRSEGG